MLDIFKIGMNHVRLIYCVLINNWAINCYDKTKQFLKFLNTCGKARNKK